MIFDTHCHLNFSDFKDDLDQVIETARGAGVKFFLNAGCDLNSSYDAIKLSEKYSHFFSSAGIHPHYAAEIDERDWQEFENLAGDNIAAIGECGLDYHRNLSPRNKQLEVFEKQIIVSKDLKLPLIIHSREAEEDLMAVLRHFDVKEAVMHCFSGDKRLFDFCVERGFFVSFAGNITYPKSSRLRDMAGNLPVELLLLETDCPFLSPQPFRGRRCEPRYLTCTRDELSKLKSIENEKLDDITTNNAFRCFKIKL